MGERLAFLWFRVKVPVLALLAVLSVSAAAAIGYMSVPAPPAVVTGSLLPVGSPVPLAVCLGDAAPGTREFSVALSRCLASPSSFPPAVAIPADSAGVAVLDKRSGLWSFTELNPTLVESSSTPPESQELQLGASVAVADLDNDGHLELIVGEGSGLEAARRAFFYGPGALSVLSGVGGSESSGELRGLPSGGVFEVTSIVPADWDADGWVDLAVTSAAPAGTATAPQLRLFRNRSWAAPGFFEDVTRSSGAEAALAGAFANTGNFGPTAGGVLLEQALVADFDADGHTDLFVLSRFGLAAVLWGDGSGRFDDVAAFEVPVGARAAAAADLNRDGLLDVVVAVAGPATVEHCLLARPCASSATDALLLLGRTGRAFAASSFELPPIGSANAVRVLDVDNDGWLDMVFGVEPRQLDPESLIAAADTQNLVLLTAQVAGGELAGFAAATLPGDPTPPVSSLLVIDFDGDGRQDVLVGSLTAGGMLVWRNETDTAAFLQVELAGAASFTATGSSRDGFGAVVEVSTELGTWTRQVGLSSSARHAGSSSVLHFGLGQSEQIRSVKVLWPSGRVSLMFDADINVRTRIVEPSR